MTKKEFIIAYNIGHRDGKLDEYLPNDYPEFIGQQSCDDCVSREAVLEYIEGSEAELGHSTENELVCQDIKEFPPVTPQPKIGYWTIKQYQVPIENKQVPTISGITFPAEPTACKIIYTYTHSVCKSEEYLNKYNYCPNCGAKMAESEE